jgi:putative transposase
VSALLMPTEDDLDAWGADPALGEDEPRADYDKRKKALRQVVEDGKTVAAAAKDCGVDRRTLAKILEDALALGPDGQPWGWRACIPNRVRRANPDAPAELPDKAGPGAFGKLLRAVPELVALLLSFTRRLPTRAQRSTSFENFFEKFLTLVRKKTDGRGYPLNAPDQGRRSVIEYLRRLRESAPDGDSEAEQAEQAAAKQLNEVFAFGVMERLEFDAHRMDCDFCLEVPDASGRTSLREISYVWLLVLIDSVSRLVLAHVLVVGRAYTQIDVLRVFSRSLVPWEARELLVPGMQYVPGSGSGTVPVLGRLLRGILSAADNALAHHAKLTTANLTRYFRGVLSLGTPRVPETRGILEALFRKLENGAIRQIPGGFEPARDADTPKRATTGQTADKHPLNPVALADLLDVVIAGYNITPLASLRDQSPLEIVRHFGTGGGWTFESPLSASDAAELTVMRLPVRIKGDRRKHRQPYVRYLYARYRAFGLRDRWDLVGKTFQARLSTDDMRYITLFDERGEVFVRLTALPPWSRTRHDYDLRRLIHRWSERGLFTIAGVDDAIEAYRLYVRTHAHEVPAASTSSLATPTCTADRTPRRRPSRRPASSLAAAA